MPTTWLPDEVWAQLDPRQERLTKRARRALAALLAATALATTLIALGVTSGELGGSLYVPRSSTRVDTRSHDFVQTISVTNNSWFDETVTGAANSDRHIDVTDMRPARVTIPHSTTRTLTLHFHVTDCAAVAPGNSSTVLHLERFWGTQSVTIDVLGWTNGGQPGSYPVGGSGPAWAACGRDD